MCKSYYACATCDMIQSGENEKLTSKESRYSFFFFVFWLNFNLAMLLIIFILIHIINIKQN